MVLPFQRRSPPEVPMAPVSRFRVELVGRTVVSLKSARMAPANAQVRMARARIRAREGSDFREMKTSMMGNVNRRSFLSGDLRNVAMALLCSFRHPMGDTTDMAGRTADAD